MSHQRKITRPNNGSPPRDQTNRRNDLTIRAEAHNGRGDHFLGTVITGQHPDGALTPDTDTTTQQKDIRDVALSQDVDHPPDDALIVIGED